MYPIIMRRKHNKHLKKLKKGEEEESNMELKQI